MNTEPARPFDITPFVDEMARAMFEDYDEHHLGHLEMSWAEYKETDPDTAQALYYLPMAKWSMKAVPKLAGWKWGQSITLEHHDSDLEVWVDNLIRLTDETTNMGEFRTIMWAIDKLREIRFADKVES